MTGPAHWTGHLAYLGIFAAAAIEGEIVFVTAAVLAAMGQLNLTGVLIAGALGGSAGDQFYFYALRGPLWKWLPSFAAPARRRRAMIERVQRRKNVLILASRFLPGLRVAISAACACAGVSPLRFTSLSLISGFAWASAIIAAIAWLGPQAITSKSWWTPLIPATLILLFFFWLGRKSRSLEAPASNTGDAS